MKKIILSIFILLPLFSFAASTDYKLLEPLPPIENSGQSINCDDPNLKMVCKIDSNHYIAYVFNFSIAFASVAAVIVIIIAGFEYATSGIANTKSDAKSRIENAVLGLVTILCSYLILKTIDPRLVDINTELPVIEAPGQIFNFDGLENDVTDFKIKQSLDQSLATSNEMKSKAADLRSEAADLRRQAEANKSDPEKSKEFETQALKKEQEAQKLESGAAYVTAASTADARYTLLMKNLSEFAFDDSQKIKDTYKLGADQISGGIDNSIARLKKIGAVEEAAKLEKEKTFYLDSFKQDFAVEEAINYYKEFPGSIPRQEKARILALHLEKNWAVKDVNLDYFEDSSYVPRTEITDPVLKERFEKETTARIERIRAIVPPLKAEIEHDKKP